MVKVAGLFILSLLCTMFFVDPIKKSVEKWTDFKMSSIATYFEKRRIEKAFVDYWKLNKSFKVNSVKELSKKDDGVKVVAVFYTKKSDDGEFMYNAADILWLEGEHVSFLLHKKDFGAVIDVEEIEIDGRPYYAFLHYHFGTGGFLSLSVHEVVDSFRPKQVFLSEEFFKGSHIKTAGKLLIKGDNQRFELVKKGAGVALARHKDSIKADPNSGTHVLAYRLDSKGGLNIYFNEKQLNFSRLGEDKFESEKVSIDLNERIFIDDNMDTPQAIRTMYDYESGFDIRYGFFQTIIPVDYGEASISVSFNYDKWYHIPIVTEKATRF